MKIIVKRVAEHTDCPAGSTGMNFCLFFVHNVFRLSHKLSLFGIMSFAMWHLTPLLFNVFGLWTVRSFAGLSEIVSYVVVTGFHADVSSFVALLSCEYYTCRPETRMCYPVTFNYCSKGKSRNVLQLRRAEIRKAFDAETAQMTMRTQPSWRWCSP